MKCIITIDCDNSAFADDPAPELERILLSLASRVGPHTQDDGDRLEIHDANGNHVGQLVMKGGAA